MKQAAISPPKDRVRAPPKANGGGVEFPIITKKRARPDAAGSRSTRTTSPDKVSRLPKVSASSNTITYSAKVPATDNGEELEVVKCILVREGYLQRLARASADSRVSGAHLGETVDLLDLLRVATLECVEAIATWRKRTQRELNGKASVSDVIAPYLWNGVNYLLKIPSDIEFLGKHTALTQWLGFTLERNPFILPVNLDCRTKLNIGGLASPERTPHAFVDDSSRFIEVGGKRIPENPRMNTAAAFALAERKRAKNPYETRVINDEELMPTSPLSAATPEQKPKEAARPTTHSQHRHPTVLPSQIGDLDMMRIEDAEMVLLEEEGRFGQLTRDWQGRIVPVEEARRRANMIAMAGGVYFAGNDATNETSSSPRGQSSDGDTRNESETLSKLMVTAPGSVLSGKFITKKHAGVLGPISKPATALSKTKPHESTGPFSYNNRGGQPPLRSKTHGQSRSRGAQYEDALELERLALTQFESAMDTLREQIERKDMDVAYFESIFGLQLLGDELKELAKTSIAEAAILRQELAEKKAIWERKCKNIDRKQDIITTYKVEQKSAVDKRHRAQIEEIKSKGTTHESQPMSLNGNPAEGELQLVAPVVKNLCATIIQAQARGMLARKAFVRMRVAFVVASTFIQAGARGFLVRRRVARLFWERTAIIQLQRVARGMLSRRRVRTKRLALRIEKSAQDIQRIVRGRLGRVRMRKIRDLFAARSNLVASIAQTEPTSLAIVASDLKDLASSCARMIAVPSLLKSISNVGGEALSSLVLGIVRILMLFTSDSDDEWDIPNARWREAAQFLSCSVSLLRRMKKISLAANDSKRHIRHSSLGCKLLETLANDPFFCVTHFETLSRGARAACAIFRWILAYAEVTKLQHVLPDGDTDCLPPLSYIKDKENNAEFFVVSKALSDKEQAQERAERKENRINEEVAERHFVPVELLRCTQASSLSGEINSHRKRAVLLVVASDMPVRAKHSILKCLMEALPGRFVIINSPHPNTKSTTMTYVGAMTQDRTVPQARIAQGVGKVIDASVSPPMFDIHAIRSAISLGYCVVLEGDIGLRDASRRRFINAFAAVKAAIHPSPHCVLLRGSLKNRPEEQDPQMQTSTKVQRSAMVDGELKVALENAAQHLFVLSQPRMTTEMEATSTISDDPTDSIQPHPSLVLVMEAVIVLLTPGKTYAGPNASSTVVSWRLSRRLLGNPRFLQLKLAAVRADTVPIDNLVALDRYLSHPAWPSRHHALSQQSFQSAATNGQEEYQGSVYLLNALSSWVESIVSLAHSISDGNGIVASITRSRPVLGLFGSVITYSNADETHGASTQCFSNEPESETSLANWIVEGENLAMRELLDAALADVCIYRTAHELDGGERCIVSVFRDCGRFFFSAYAPGSSQRWMTAISEAQVETLLAPNSLERADCKRPPTTIHELCDRLVRLSVIQTGAYSGCDVSKAPVLPSAEVSSLVHSNSQLVIRPRAIRLLRRVLCVGGIMATVTLSELSRGRVQVDAFVHGNDALRNACIDDQQKFVCINSVGAVRTIVGLESILERMSAEQASRIPAYLPSRLANMVLDRLHLFHSRQTRAKRSEISGRRVPLCVTHQLLVPANPSSDGIAVRVYVRTRERSPGRVHIRRAIYLPGESIEESSRAELWILSLVQMHVGETFVIELYHPRSSRRLSAELPPRELQDFVSISKFTTPSQLHRVVKRVFRLKFSSNNEPEDENDMSGSESENDDAGASKVITQSNSNTKTDHQAVKGLRINRTLARFPAALPHAREKHQDIPKTCRRVRVYVQVESQVMAGSVSHRFEKESERGLLVRVFIPESCEEHEIMIGDSEIETWIEEGLSWAKMSTCERACTIRKLVQSTFEWHGQNGSSRVSARLPSGTIFSHKPKRQQPQITDGARHIETYQSNMESLAQVASSCVVLLDEDEPELADVAIGGDEVLRCPSKWCLHYDKEELVYRATHRANGELLVVQVYMKAVIRARLVPLVPTDRVVQEDSFVMSFQCYHPHSSSHTTVTIDGRRDLREIVGPDRAYLISSSNIRELLRHIIEARMEVKLEAPDKEPARLSSSSPSTVMREYREREQHKRRQDLKIVFERDRLFGKQKVTPITATFETDATINAVKLIDRASDRGVKVLSRAKVLEGCGRIIFTFFNISNVTRRWRLDAYVTTTSERLSLVLESHDLFHVVGDRVELLLGFGENNGAEKDKLNGAELLEQQHEYERELAVLVIDHVGIEQKRDGRCKRLYLSEYYLPPPTNTIAAKEGKKKRSLLFKTVRSVDESQLVISMYLEDQSVVVDVYEPATSSKSSLDISLTRVGAVLGFSESLALALLRPESGGPSTIDRSTLMAHLSSFIRVSKRNYEHYYSEWHQRRNEIDATSFRADLCFDESQGLEKMRLFLMHKGCCDSATKRLLDGVNLSADVIQQWIGPMTAVGGRYISLHVSLVLVDSKRVLVISAYSPLIMVVATTSIDSESLRHFVPEKRGESLPAKVDQEASDLLPRIARTLRVELAEDIGAIESNVRGITSNWSLRIQAESHDQK